ncbi:uncharacterized protein F4822DRAFT_408810 [Hypoxylon trugodes]|uniref:uncharacterized protein n=1 Tax=Hypoxylon trugodes TaxID=326681 RepID=UPI0021941472|nr:uncharacterized protein F4822DRAFT_408810 [Hypoxylon trugodes]KAI1386045.1 hypothetical protein F4822DRAFT_408810 [Hypoxylon trugodes]
MAESYSVFSKYNEAEEMYRQTLELKEQVLGREHPSILKSKANLDVCLKAKMDKGLS